MENDWQSWASSWASFLPDAVGGEEIMAQPAVGEGSDYAYGVV